MSDPLVYSTETGRIAQEKDEKLRPKSDGIVRIQRQTAGRKGKGVCVVTGLDVNENELITFAAALKKRCGCGGSVKNHAIEIQGDKRDVIKTFFEEKGFTVKFSGG